MQNELNYEILLAITTLSLTILCCLALLFKPSSNRRTDLILISFILNFGFVVLQLVMPTIFSQKLWFQVYFPFPLHLAFAPLLLAYLFLQLRIIQKLNYYHYLLFVPAIMEILAILFLLIGNEKNPMHGTIQQMLWILEFGKVLFDLILIIYLLVRLWQVMAEDNLSGSTFGFWFLGGYGLTHYVLTLLVTLLVNTGVVNMIAAHLLAALDLVFLVAVYYPGFSMKAVPSSCNAEHIEKYPKCQLDRTAAEKILMRSNEKLLSCKLFLNPELKLDCLATELNINRTYLSQSINYQGSNFHQYINAFRVAEFIRRIESQENLTMTLFGVASQCGFKNKSTFYKAFKEAKDTTPNEYVKSIALVKHDDLKY